jgi:hypothetical protein
MTLTGQRYSFTRFSQLPVTSLFWRVIARYLLTQGALIKEAM